MAPGAGAGGPFTLLAVHAHPDDESSSTGGLLLRAAAEGHRTVLVTLTNGERGEVVDRRLRDLRPQERAEDRARLGEVRLQELREAARILGVGDLYPLGYLDSGMAGWASNADPAAFANQPLEEPAGRLARIVREYRPHVLVTYDAKGGYGHPDHIKAHLAAMAALEEAERPGPGQAPWRVPKVYHTALSRARLLRAWRLLRLLRQKTPMDRPGFRADLFGSSEEEISARVDIRPYLSRKWRALKAHRSQIGGSAFWRLMRITARWTFPEETFGLIRSDVPVRKPERSLFEGLD